LTAATEVIPAVSDLTAMLPVLTEEGEPERPRRPRPRPGVQDRPPFSTVYVSRHAAD
jgi:hypothetical protein